MKLIGQWFVVCAALCVAGLQTQLHAAPTSYCDSGQPIDSESNEFKAASAAPGDDVLAIYNEVEDPSACSYVTADRRTDYSKPGHECKPICGEHQTSSGILMSCLNEAVDSAFQSASGDYRALARSTEGLPIEMLSPKSADIESYFQTDVKDRGPIRIRVNGEEITIDSSRKDDLNHRWSADWDQLVAKADAACKGTAGKSGDDCSRVTQSAAAFAAHLKNLEKAALLRSKLAGKTGLDPAHVELCARPAHVPVHASDSGKSSEAQPQRKGAPKVGVLKKSWDECESQEELQGVCEVPTSTGLENFEDQLNRISAHPGVMGNYIDLLRIQSLSDLLKTHHLVVGKPLETVPPGCSRFTKGIEETMRGGLTPAESKEAADSVSPAGIQRLVEKAQYIQQMLKLRESAKRVPRNTLHGKTSLPNSRYPEALEAIEFAERQIRDTVARFPLLAARNGNPDDDMDLPTPKLLAQAKPEQIADLVKKAQGQVSTAIYWNIAKACNNRNDEGGYETHGDSASWIDLVRQPRLTERTTRPPFARFKRVQECLTRKAESIAASRGGAMGGAAAGCLAGTTIGGPFVGVPCALLVMGMTFLNYEAESNRFAWTKECQETTGSLARQALCSSTDYLNSRAGYELALEQQRAAFAFAAMAGGHAIYYRLFSAAKALSAPELAQFATRMQQRGADLVKIASDIDVAVGAESSAASEAAAARSPGAYFFRHGEVPPEYEMPVSNQPQAPGAPVGHSADIPIEVEVEAMPPSSEESPFPSGAIVHPTVYKPAVLRLVNASSGGLGNAIEVEGGTETLYLSSGPMEVKIPTVTVKVNDVVEDPAVRMAKVLQKQGRGDGTPLKPFGKGGQQKVFHAPDVPDGLIKVANPETPPDLTATMAQRNQTFLPILNQEFRALGLRIRGVDYSLTEEGASETTVIRGKKIGQYIDSAEAEGRPEDAVDMQVRMVEINRKRKELTPVLSRFQDQRWGIQMSKADNNGTLVRGTGQNVTAEDAAIDLGRVGKLHDPLDQCYVIEGEKMPDGSPWIECFDF